MGIIKILLQREALVFRNSYLRTRKQLVIGVVLAILVPVGLGVTTWALRDIVSALLEELGINIIAPLFHIIFVVFLIFSFGAMQNQARLRLLNLPELSLLITSPISTSTLYLFRVILVTFSARGALFLLFVAILPGLIAVGIAGGAPWYYYLFVLPVAYSLLIVAASFAVILILLLVWVLSPKKIAQGASVLGFLGMALWIGFMIWGLEEIEPLLLEWARAKELFWHITLPATDAAALLTGLIHEEILLWPLSRLFMVTGVILGGSMLIARRVYYRAYERVQVAEISTKKQVKRPVREPLSPGRRSNVILTEWKLATRNYDVALVAITILAILGGYPFFARGFVLPEPWSNLLLLAHVGVIGFLTSMTVEVFFTPLAEGQDSCKTRKEQLTVLKSTPFSAWDFVSSYWLTSFTIKILISGAILLVLHILLGSSILTILLSLVILVLLVGSAAAFESGLSMAAMGGNWWLDTPAGRYVCELLLPILYYILALTILGLGIIYTEIGFLSFLHHLPQRLGFTISGAIFLALTGFTLYYFLRLCARGWEEMEI